MSFNNQNFMAGYLTGVELGRRRSKPVEPISTGYIKFYSDEPIGLSIKNSTKNWDGTLEYSVDETTWNIWDGTDTIFSSSNYILLRGHENTGITNTSNTDSVSYEGGFVFSASNDAVYCEGNIENLLDCDAVSDGVQPVMSEYCFAGLFLGELLKTYTPIKNTLDMPSMNLSVGCYAYMYSQSLVEISSELPALVVPRFAYADMFNCSRLQKSVSLPATSLSPSCYRLMYYMCPVSTLSLLPNVQSLPATCYYRMYEGCPKIKLSKSQDAEYTTPYQVKGERGFRSVTDMFSNTGGSWHSGPLINTTYYTANEVV